MDNYYSMCPAKMSDGRFTTDYRPHVQMEEYIKYINNINRDDRLRLFLQGNACKIMDAEWKHLRNNNSCWVNQCVHNYPTRVFPAWFAEELRDYNMYSDPNIQTNFKCAKFSDYRMF